MLGEGRGAPNPCVSPPLAVCICPVIPSPPLITLWAWCLSSFSPSPSRSLAKRSAPRPRGEPHAPRGCSGRASASPGMVLKDGSWADPGKTLGKTPRWQLPSPQGGFSAAPKQARKGHRVPTPPLPEAMGEQHQPPRGAHPALPRDHSAPFLLWGSKRMPHVPIINCWVLISHRCALSGPFPRVSPLPAVPWDAGTPPAPAPCSQAEEQKLIKAPKERRGCKPPLQSRG